VLSLIGQGARCLHRTGCPVRATARTSCSAVGDWLHPTWRIQGSLRGRPLSAEDRDLNRHVYIRRASRRAREALARAADLRGRRQTNQASVRLNPAEPAGATHCDVRTASVGRSGNTPSIRLVLPGSRQDTGPHLIGPFGLEASSVTDVITVPDLAAIKQRQQATWASQNGR